MSISLLDQTKQWVSSHPKTILSLSVLTAALITMGVLLKLGLLQKTFKPIGNFFKQVSTLANQHPIYTMAITMIVTLNMYGIYRYFKHRDTEKLPKFNYWSR